MKFIFTFLFIFLISFKAEGIPILNLEPASEGFSSPVVIARSNFKNIIFVAEQCGKIFKVDIRDGSKTFFMDISRRVSCSGEQGLLGVAFPPAYRRSRNFYLHYSDLNGNTVLSRFKASARSLLKGNRRSEQKILRVTQPFSNHNGGPIAFGPDKLLYFGLGDGGSGGDPLNLAQNKKSLLGKILRLNVEGRRAVENKSYTIPASNPFVNRRGKDEIWAYGLRNPWKFSFDRSTGDFWIADVGQGDYEEINLLPSGTGAGSNLGWNITEGLNCFNPSSGCDSTGITFPVFQYGHNTPENHCSVTGGYVFRSANYSESILQGKYLSGDLCSGFLFILSESASVWSSFSSISTGLQITAFGEDYAGDLYVADYGTGIIYRIIPQI